MAPGLGKEANVMDWVKWGAKICAILAIITTFILYFSSGSGSADEILALNISSAFGILTVVLVSIALGHWLWTRYGSRAGR